MQQSHAKFYRLIVVTDEFVIIWPQKTRYAIILNEYMRIVKKKEKKMRNENL